MNDLTSELYHHLDRKQPLNLQHCKIFMKTIGKFHALSFALKDYCQRKNIDFDEIVYKIREDIFLNASNRDEINEQILLQNDFIIQTCFDTNVDQLIIEKVNNFSKRFCNTLYELIQPKDNDEYSVIIHGDCWTNNLLYKYEDNETKSNPIDLYLIDFQESRYTSPVWDLTTFMCTSMDYETLHTNYDSLIKIYYDSINEQLIKMNLNISLLYPDHIFQLHLQKYFQIGVGLSVYMHLPLMLRNHSTSINELEESVIAEDGNILKALNLSDTNIGNNFRERIRGVLTFAIERNFI
ncbi:uncharacterized protein LOC123293369 [Chrysoperla carnea]|uniref:uncharacterized protein LOC123293369 n=1 Tax=Chrysoperla carnea TaxID=189513 RepID=UPI001D092FFD|nr:uncharacterized protein LOC123293369 [Chrysoperla carnea]